MSSLDRRTLLAGAGVCAIASTVPTRALAGRPPGLAVTIDLDGAPTVRVTVSTSLPGLGFLPGPIPVEVHGHAHRF